jgi:hypothetical protein
VSTDLIVLFDSQDSTADAGWLREKLIANPPEVLPVIERYRSRWRIQEWQCVRGSATGQIELQGPGGFSIDFESQVVEIYHLIPFSHFACDAQAREQLRTAWRWFAHQLRSPRAIYTHELMPYSGCSLSEIEAGLRSKIGPPARDFGELARAEYFSAGAWYIEEFAD